MEKVEQKRGREGGGEIERGGRGRGRKRGGSREGEKRRKGVKVRGEEKVCEEHNCH